MGLYRNSSVVLDGKTQCRSGSTVQCTVEAPDTSADCDQGQTILFPRMTLSRLIGCMCSFGKSTRIRLFLTDSPTISEFDHLGMIVRTTDLEHVRRGVEFSRGIPGGNTRRRFHGTVRECCLGDTSSEGALCRLSTCNLCRIIQVPLECAAGPFWHSGVLVLQSSFQLAKAGQRTNFGRFGAGIYTSATSSKVSSRCIPGSEALTSAG